MNLKNTSLTLLECLKVGENKAWLKFEVVYKGRLRYHLSRVLSNSSDVDEVYQEVLLILHRKINSFDRRQEGSFRRFLRTICYRSARDRIEKVRNHRLQSANSDQAPFFDVEQLADDNSELSRLWNDEHRQFVTETVVDELRRRCGDRKTEIYLELGREEMSREQIADLFQISPATLFRIQAEVRRTIHEIQSEFGEILDL